MGRTVLSSKNWIFKYYKWLVQYSCSIYTHAILIIAYQQLSSIASPAVARPTHESAFTAASPQPVVHRNRLPTECSFLFVGDVPGVSCFFSIRHRCPKCTADDSVPGPLVWYVVRTPFFCVLDARWSSWCYVVKYNFEFKNASRFCGVA